MKISCTQERLNRGLNIVSRVVGNRVTLPVLSNIFLETKDGQLKLSATDLEIGVITSVSAKVDSEGALTVPARLISEFIATNTDENLEIEAQKNSLHIKSQRYEANINGIDATEFPTIPEVDQKSMINLKSADFLAAIKEVIIACANDDTRPVLAGVYFKFEKGILYLVTTDSYRLAEKKIEIEDKTIEKEFIVPARTIHELIRIASLLEKIENIGISASENQVAFNLGETQIVSRLIEGAFPNYKQIIPTGFKSNAKVDLKEFSSAVKMAALFARQSANNIKIKFIPNELLITSVADQIGDNISKVNCETTGDEVEIAFNAKYVTDILTVLNDKNLIFEVNDKASPGVIKSEKDKDFVYIIMPLRVEE